MDLIKTMLAQALYLYSIVLIIYILMSWVPGARESRFGEFLGRLSEPYLEVFRRIIPPIGMIDISPIVALLVLNFAQRGLYELFFMLGI